MKYTFEDWLDGMITDINSLYLQYVLNREQGINEPCLPYGEYEKIIQAKKQAFDWAVEINTDSLIWIAEKNISRVQNPENWLRLEINKTEKFINDNPELEKDYEEGKRDLILISGERYKRIKKSYESCKNGGRAGSIIERVVKKHKGKSVPSQLQRMYEHKTYLNWLKDRKGKHGRPEDFPKEDTLQWYKELIQDPDYHKKDGSPHLSNIQEEIARKHTDKTGFTCGSEAIRKQIYTLRKQGSL